jgi:mRNA interferase RelE/StbE
MEVLYNKSFLKIIKKLRDKNLLDKIEKTIIEIENTKNILELSDLKKMVGFETFYRIKIGNYRLGIEIAEKTVYFIEFQHRKDIYKKFP